MNQIKNIPHETALALSEQIAVLPGQVVSMTLAQNKAVSITLFAFDQGEEISAHAAPGDAMVTVLEGTGRFSIDGTPHICHAGQTIVMPEGKPHAVYAEEAFKMLLSIVFSDNT